MKTSLTETTLGRFTNLVPGLASRVAIMVLSSFWLAAAPAPAQSINERVQAAIAACDKAEMLQLLQFVTDPNNQRLLLDGLRDCLLSDIERGCDDADADALLDLHTAIATTPFLRPEDRAALMARLTDCFAGLAEAEIGREPCDLERLLNFYALTYIFDVPAKLRDRLGDAVAKCFREEIDEARRNGDRERLYELMELLIGAGDGFPDEHVGDLTGRLRRAYAETIPRDLIDLLKDFSAPDWEARWEELFLLAYDIDNYLLDNKTAYRLQDQALAIYAHWLEDQLHAARKTCDLAALDAIEARLDNSLGGVFLDEKLKKRLRREIDAARKKCG